MASAESPRTLLVRFEGGEFRGGDEALLVGRSHYCDVRLTDLRVSRRQLRLLPGDGSTWTLRVEQDAAAVFLEGSVVAELAITGPMTVRLADAQSGPWLEVIPVSSAAGSPVAGPGRPVSHGPPGPPPPAIQIGRSRDNDVVVADLLVSRHHCRLEVAGERSGHIVDLDSANGTFVGGRRVAEAILRDGDLVTMGGTRLRYERGSLEVCPAQALGLRVDDLTVTLPDGQRLLDSVTFALERGALLAVVGPTGAGKSTLLKALTGFRFPDAGQVLVGERPLYESFEEIRRGIAYVPQEDILHPQLTTRRALEFGAELRFGGEVSKDERLARVAEVMDELGLTRRADVQIERLSGGQRKRTSVALELLTRPSLMMLDEPTSGLDPGFEKSVMELLHELTEGGRTVVVVTHSIASLHLCDRVLFLAPGGRTAFFGPPQQALAHFGRQEYAEVFQDLERQEVPGPAEGASVAPVPRAGRHERAPASRPATTAATWCFQLGTLIRRHAAIIAADKRNLGFLAAEVLIPALLILSLVGQGALRAGNGANHSARTLLGALAVSAAAIGAANALREIVKEVPLYHRERAAGLIRSAYLASKVVVLGAVTLAQVVALVLIATARADGPVSTHVLPGRAELIFDLFLTALGALALGLLISSLVNTSEKAMALIAAIFVAEWLFSGAAVDLRGKVGIEQVAYSASANWGMAAAASSVDLPGLDACGARAGPVPGAPAVPPCDRRWAHDPLLWLLDLLGLLALTGGALVCCNYALSRREPTAGFRRGRGRSRGFFHQPAGRGP